MKKLITVLLLLTLCLIPCAAASAQTNDRANVTLKRVYHYYRGDSTVSGDVINCYYDLASVADTSAVGRKINAVFSDACEKYFEDPRCIANGETLHAGQYTGQTRGYHHGKVGAVAQNGDGYLSIKYTQDWMLGGVGDGSSSGITVDLRSGRRLYLADLPTRDGTGITQERLNQIVVAYCRQQFGAQLLKDFASGFERFREKRLSEHEFYLENDQVILCVAKYEIGPGALGAFDIPTGIYCVPNVASSVTNTRGDADLNGKVLANDARLVLRASARLETLTGQAFKNCDLDGSGKLTAKEARLILRYSAKLESKL